MFASVVFLSAVQYKTLSVSGEKVPIGIDAATIGKFYGGHYVANRDFLSLPKVSEIPTEKVKFFSGNVYILPSKTATQATITYFQSGRKREFHKDTGKVDYDMTIGDFISSFSGSDIRAADATYASFEVSLPKEAKKLDGFTGTITYFAKNMTGDQTLTIKLKNGKVVGSRT